MNTDRVVLPSEIEIDREAIRRLDSERRWPKRLTKIEKEVRRERYRHHVRMILEEHGL